MPIVGEIRAFAFGARSRSFREIVNAGWIPCDGRDLAWRLHQALHDAIQDTWGTKDPAVNFAVPNFSGSFLRGLSLGPETIDPDADARSVPRPEYARPGNAGRQVGSFQDSEFSAHAHEGRGMSAGGAAINNGLGLTAVRGGVSNTHIGMSSEGGNETRPKNHCVMYMIYGGSEVPVKTKEHIISSYSDDN